MDITNIVRNALQDPFVVAFRDGVGAINSYLAPSQLRTHADYDIKNFGQREIGVIEGREVPASSMGSTFLGANNPVIYVNPALEEADKDAYDFFLKREVVRIDSAQAVLEPIVMLTTHVALSILIPTTWPVLLVIPTWYVASQVTRLIFSTMYEHVIENRTINASTLEEKKGALRFIKMMQQIKPSYASRLYKKLQATPDWQDSTKEERIKTVLELPLLNLVENEDRIRPSYSQMEKTFPFARLAFEARAKKYRELKKEDVIGICVPLIANACVAIVETKLFSMRAAMLLNRINDLVIKRVLRSWEKSRFVDQVREVDAKLNRNQLGAIQACWVVGSGNARFQRIISPV